MGPNLTRLFNNTKLGTNSDAIAASEALRDLFKDHGEALIAALDTIMKYGELASVQLETRGPRSESKEVWQFQRHYCHDIEKLLAQIEAEAQP